MDLTLDPSLRWTRLAVLGTHDGGLFDATGTVRFRAVYLQHGKRGVLAETSGFARRLESPPPWRDHVRLTRYLPAFRTRS
jgi:uncharacterized protein YchJ